MTSNTKPDTKNIALQLAKEFGLNLSTRYLCPSSTHNSNSPSYSLGSNYCFSCKHKANDTVQLIDGLIKSNPKVFRFQEMSVQTIKGRLKKANIPFEFIKSKTSAERIDDKKHRQEIISRLLTHKKSEIKSSHGKFEIDKTEFEYLAIELRMGGKYTQPTKFPVTVYYQRLSKNNSISIPSADIDIGPNFMSGNYNPSEIILTSSPSKVVDTELKDGQFIFATEGWLPKTVTNAIDSELAKKVVVEDERAFELILGHAAKNEVALPEIEILNPKTNIKKIPANKLKSLFSPTDIRPPEGVNYLNIDKPQEFDDVVEIGGQYLIMGDGIEAENKALVKTGAVSLIEVFTGERRKISNHFESDGEMIKFALEQLRAQEQTENIKKEINLIESITDGQKKSLDIQLKVAKAIKELFGDEFWGVKGSANNLNILYIMGVTSVDPSKIQALTPYSFLSPNTDKNPDFDFELSSSQISRLLAKYPEFVKALTVTSLGDRVHVCKYFLNLEAEHKVYQLGDYVPVESLQIEESTSATPVDLLSSKVVDRINTLKKQTGQVTVPEDYRVSKKSLEDDNLPHFNNSVLRQLRDSSSEDDFDLFELANMCSANRPIFYRSKVVLSNKDGKNCDFSVSQKKGYENFTPLNPQAEKLIESGLITEKDIIGFNRDEKGGYKRSTKIAGLDIKVNKSNYLTDPPKWAVVDDEPVLDVTGGVIRYQEQLMMLLNKYTEMSTSDITAIIKDIAHSSKTEGDDRIEVVFNKGTPNAIKEQINFIVKSPESFFFKMGHALFLSETARLLSYLTEQNKPRQSGAVNGNVANIVEPVLSSYSR